MARYLQAVSASYSLRPGDLGVDVTTGASTITVTLPNAAGVRKEYDFRVSKVDTGAGLVSVVPSGSETIYGRTAVTLTRAFQVSTFVSDGSNWHVKAHGGLNFRLGAYGTPVPYTGVGLCNMYALDSVADAAVSLVGFWLMRSTTVDGALGLQILVESECVATGPIGSIALDALAGLTSASSILASAGSDHTAGLFAVHAKAYGISGSTTSAGSRVAAIWLDCQLNGGNHSTSAYYSIYATSGGLAFSSFARLQLIGGEGAGWTNLLSFNFGEGTAPLVANTVFDETTPSGGITIDVNGTPRYIPYYPAG